MTDILDMAAQRAPLPTIDEGPLASRPRPASRGPAEREPAASERAQLRAPRRWVGAALASLLAGLLLAGAYRYVTGVHVTDDPYVIVGESGVSTDVSCIVKEFDVACSSSPYARSPRSRPSPRAIVGGPESRQDDLHLAALPLHTEACPPTSTSRFPLLDVVRLMLTSLQEE